MKSARACNPLAAILNLRRVSSLHDAANSLSYMDGCLPSDSGGHE